MRWLGRQEFLGDDELVRVIGLFARGGMSELRITGSERLVAVPDKAYPAAIE